MGNRGVSGSFGGTFDDKLFMASHGPAVVDEDERLLVKSLNVETKLWYEWMVN